MLWSIVALLLGLAVVWFTNNFDRVAYQHPSGYEPQARKNRLLAAEMLLNRLGIDASSSITMTTLPDTRATLILPVSRRKFSRARLDALDDWMRAGGHLVVVATVADEEGSNDPLLDRHDITAVEQDGWDEQYGLSEVFGKTLERPLEIEITQTVVLEGSASALAFDQHGTRAMTTSVGQGRLTALTDLRFMTNAYLGDRDHAAFLWHIVSLETGPRAVMVLDETRYGLLDRIWEHGWQLVLSLALISAVWLWWSAGRFGPMLPSRPLPCRRLLEHIEASGRFLWTQKQGGSLVDDLRLSLLRSLEFRRPGWSASPNLAERLADLTGLETAMVERALEPAAVRDEAEFLNIIRILETIRKRL
ncbi:MAG: hypothetical protein CMO26_11230 [Thiotrichales bacterium]|nr:hypothetical protein [Thiotrichales bacterium]